MRVEVKDRQRNVWQLLIQEDHSRQWKYLVILKHLK